MKKIIIIVLLALFSTTASAQIIGATDKRSSNHHNDNTLNKSKGHYLMVEGGYPKFISIGYGYQFNPIIMLGAGIGYGKTVYSSEQDNIYIRRQWHYDWYHDDSFGYNYPNYRVRNLPIYIDLRISTPLYKWNFFTNLKIGGNIPLFNHTVREFLGKLKTPVFSTLTLGFGYKNLDFGLGISSYVFYGVDYVESIGEWGSSTIADIRPFMTIFIKYNIPL